MVSVRNSPIGARWWKPARLFGSQREALDQRDKHNGIAALVQGVSAQHATQTNSTDTESITKTMETCLICEKPIVTDQRAIMVRRMSNGSMGLAQDDDNPEPGRSTVHQQCFRQELLCRHW